MYNRTSVCGIKINTESGLKNMAAEKQPPKHPEISIIVPVYKVEKYLNECIDSILAQTFTDFEVILVDDGSPDGCPALCDAAAAKDSRIRVIHQQNKGLSGARNAGLDIACGNWISFVDSDDALDKTFYEKLHRAAVQTGAEIAVCNILFIEADGSLCNYQERPLRNEVLSGEEAIHRIRVTPMDHATTKLYQRKIFAALRFPVGKNYEDAFTNPAVFEQVEKVACLEEKLYHYRMNPEGIMRGKATLKSLDEVEANYKLLQCTLKHGKKDAAFLQYALMKKYFRGIKKRLPPELRQDAKVKQTEACIAQAKTEIQQGGAYTLRNMLETALNFAAPQLYFDYKYHRKPVRKENAL